MISTLLRFRGMTRVAFERKYEISLEDSGYKVRSIPTASGWGQGIIIGLRDEDNFEIQLAIQHGYQHDKLLLVPEKCAHSEQGVKSYEHSKNSDATHSEFVTMAQNAPTEEDDLWNTASQTQNNSINVCQPFKKLYFSNL